MAQGWKKDYTRYKSFFLNVLYAYNSKPNLKIYLELILSIGTIIVFSIFAIRPTILTIIDINNEIKNKEATIAKLEKKISDLQSASGLLQRESSNLLLIDQSVPSEAELEKLIAQIESLALSNSVKISALSSSDLLLKGVMGKTKKTKDISSLPENSNELNISLSVTGDYFNLTNFVKSIENMRRPIKLDVFLFNSTKSSADEKILTLTIVGRVPYLVLEKEIAKNEK